MVLPPLTPLRRFDTHRLLPAKYGTNLDSVLTRLVRPDSPPEELAHIFELDNATNARLLAEDGRNLDITARELVDRVPQAHIINAAFTHPNPLGGRFSSPTRGAWYAAFEIATSKAEVLFHKSIEYAEIDWQEREEVLYDDYLADFTGTFHDLRPEALSQVAEPTEGTLKIQASLASQFESESNEQAHSPAATDEALDFAACLSPTSYVESQALAEALLDQGSLGVLYPSVRKPGGTCIACFRPSVVANVRKSYRYKLTWTPTRASFLRC
jgi:RES domain-containing protein